MEGEANNVPCTSIQQKKKALITMISAYQINLCIPV